MQMVSRVRLLVLQHLFLTSQLHHGYARDLLTFHYNKLVIVLPFVHKMMIVGFCIIIQELQWNEDVENDKS